MKIITLAILTLCIISSCNNGSVENTTANNISTTVIDSSSIYKQEAINTLNEIDAWMKKGVTKQASVAEVNKVVNPLMEKYTDLMSKLNLSDSTEVHEYRLKQVNEMIDLQMEQ